MDTGHDMARDRIRSAIGRLYQDIESADPGSLATWLADDIEVRLANAPLVIGKPAALVAFRSFWADVHDLHHDQIESVIGPPRAVVMSVLRYRTRDDRLCQVPEATHLRWTAEGRIDRLWRYVDITAPTESAG